MALCLFEGIPPTPHTIQGRAACKNLTERGDFWALAAFFLGVRRLLSVVRGEQGLRVVGCAWRIDIALHRVVPVNDLGGPQRLRIRESKAVGPSRGNLSRRHLAWSVWDSFCACLNAHGLVTPWALLGQGLGSQSFMGVVIAPPASVSVLGKFKCFKDRNGLGPGFECIEMADEVIKNHGPQGSLVLC